MWWAIGDLYEWVWEFTVRYPNVWLLRLSRAFIRADGPPGVNFRTRRMMDRRWWGP